MNLADLRIPKIIVMREPVSDRIAQAFFDSYSVCSVKSSFPRRLYQIWL
ncbi:MAG: hypothetical protein F6K14_05800 [Symploca sp. SIO2C1]|nr:hypothetical protein [Symploca sp. SIO2C1]